MVLNFIGDLHFREKLNVQPVLTSGVRVMLSWNLERLPFHESNYKP